MSTLTGSKMDPKIDYLAVFYLDDVFPAIRTASRLRVEVERVS